MKGTLCLTQAPSDHRVPDVVDSGDVGNERWCEFSDDDDRSEWTEGVWRRVTPSVHVVSKVRRVKSPFDSESTFESNFVRDTDGVSGQQLASGRGDDDFTQLDRRGRDDASRRDTRRATIRVTGTVYCKPGVACPELALLWNLKVIVTRLGRRNFLRYIEKSSGSPVSKNVLRLESSGGHPSQMASCTTPPDSNPSCTTVRRTTPFAFQYRTPLRA